MVLLTFAYSIFVVPTFLITDYTGRSVQNISNVFSLTEIFPGIAEKGWTPAYMAAMQISGIVVTLSIAIVGGTVTGTLLARPTVARWPWPRPNNSKPAV